MSLKPSSPGFQSYSSPLSQELLQRKSQIPISEDIELHAMSEAGHNFDFLLRDR